eukprot:gene38088-38000_t
MVLTPATRFLELDRLTSYEELRDSAAITVLDAAHKTVSVCVPDTEARLAAFKRTNTIIFLSHQWL